MRRLAYAAVCCLAATLAACGSTAGGGSSASDASGAASGGGQGAGTSSTGSSGAPAGTSSTDGTGAKTQIRFSFWSSAGDYMKPYNTLVAQFEKKYPDISVKLEVIDAKDYQTKLTTELQSGNAPDVMSVSPDYFQYFASNDQLLQLDSHLSKDIDLSKIPEGLRKEYTLDGKLFGLPENMSTVALWYNKKLFDAAGIKYPTDSWTWSDLSSAAEKLTDKSKGIYGFPVDGSTQEGYYNTVVQAGGSIINDAGTKSGLDDPKSIDGLKFLTDLQAAGVSPSYNQLQETTADSLFVSGKLAMMFGGPWHALEFQQAKLADVDVAPMPHGASDKTCVINGTSLSVWSKSKNTDAAVKFVEYATATEEGQKAFGSTGLIVPAYEGTQTAWLDQFPEYNLKAYIESAKHAVPYPTVHQGALWKKVVDQKLVPGWTGQVSIEQAAKSAADAMNAALAQGGK